MPLFSGKYGDYYWMTWTERYSFMGRLLTFHPEIVTGKYLAITALDSGPRRPNPDEIEQGWSFVDEVAYSPAIKNIDEVPTHEWEEMYTFASPAQFKPRDVFVNYGEFIVSADNDLLDVVEPHWDRFYQNLKIENAEPFWDEIERLQPESYLAEGDLLHFVTRNTALYKQVISRPPVLK
jgi:hypothetical protein